MDFLRTFYRRLGSRVEGHLFLTRRETEDVEFFPDQELDYPSFCYCNCVVRCVKALHHDSLWNTFICIMVLMAIILAAIADPSVFWYIAEDVLFNVVYFVHVLGVAISEFHAVVTGGWFPKVAFIIDLLTYAHYVPFPNLADSYVKLVCYIVRLHRPFRYLASLSDNNLKGTIMGTALKYFYIVVTLRILCALLWTEVELIEDILHPDDKKTKNFSSMSFQSSFFADGPKTSITHPYKFLKSFYGINKMFIPVGTSLKIVSDTERITCLLIMLTGCLVLTGAAVASLSLIIGIYMTPEEAFRSRYGLIMKEMSETQVPKGLQNKVETFYKMYWHKQRAVSATQLLPTFPPSLSTNVYMDIYFESMQKSHYLQNLAYQFLSEIAKKMETIHYIPGDAIIKRSSKKSRIIYISYGDIEMLTAEDDSTAILRMTRGTLLSSGGGCSAAACARAHTEIRAASFCTAHVLSAPNLWRTAWKRGRYTRQGEILLKAFNDYFYKVRLFHSFRAPTVCKHKSSILHFKKNLMALKEARDAADKPLLRRTDAFLEVAGCYVMRNREDAALTDEADAICLHPTFPCILQPNSSLLMAWDAFIAAIILAVTVSHPYYIVFMTEVPIGFWFFDYLVTGLFVLDLIAHLSTGTNVEEGVPITFAQTSPQQMRSYWFVLDVLGTVPMFEFVGTGKFAGMNKLLRLPKVFRVLKRVEESCVYQSNLIHVLMYALILIVMCYLVATLQQGFMCFQFDFCAVTNFTHSPFWEQKPMSQDYVSSGLQYGMYWAVSLISFTCHKEVWATDNWLHLSYTIILLEICLVLHVFIDAVYSATIMVTASMREQYDATIANVHSLLIKSGVDPLLQQRFTTYLALCWYTDRAYSMTNKKSIFFDLPPHVNQDILARQRSKYILCIPFMKLLYKEDLKNISSKARLFYTSPNEILLNTGDISNEMYVIKQGICEVLNPDTKDVVSSLGPKNNFGVLECVMRFPSFYTIRAVTHVQVFSISRKHLLGPMEKNAQLKDAIEFIKDQPEYESLLEPRERFISYEPPARTPNRSWFETPRKHEPDTEFLQPFKQLGTWAVLRYIFPRFTIRPDGEYLRRYECFRALCAFLSAMIVPGYTYLVQDLSYLYYCQLLLDILAFLDIVQRMLVGYFNEQGILVYHPVSTAAHYMKRGFAADFLGVIPLEKLESPKHDRHRMFLTTTQTKQILMLNRLIQLYRLPSAMLALREHIERRDIILVIKAMPFFLTLLNVLTSILVLRSVDVYYTHDNSIFYIKPNNDPGGSWVLLFDDKFRFNITNSIWKLHMTCYFWIVYETTTTGYNLLAPSSTNQMAIIVASIIIGSMMITYVSVRIISVRANVNTQLASYQEHLKDITMYMRKEQLDKNLQREVLDYYQYNWYKLGGIDYRNIFKLCDQITLRTDVILQLYGDTFSKCPLLEDCDISYLRIIGRAVRSVHFLKRTRLYEIDDIMKNIYFVDYGVVDAHVINQADDTLKLFRGSVFGNLESEATVKCPIVFEAYTNVHLLMVRADVFQGISGELADKLKELRPEGESYIAGAVCELEPDSHHALETGRRCLKFLYRHNAIVQIYLIVISVICVFADTYNAGFQDNRFVLLVTLYALDAAFLLKMLGRYALPYMIESGSDQQTQKDLIDARKEYFKSEFKYDVLSILPVELIALSVASKNSPFLFWLSILRLNRTFRIVTIYKCLMTYHERLSVNLSLTTVMSTVIWFALFVHGNTSLWYYIGTLEEAKKPKSSWMWKDNGMPWCNGSVYICSCYFVLTTFTANGVGDIMPKNVSEVVYASILMIISTMLYLVYIGEFSNIIQYQSFRSFSFYCKYLELQEFLKNNRVSKNLVHLLNNYSKHLWREARGEQLPFFLRTAPHCLKQRVMSAAYLEHLTSNTLFMKCEAAFLRQLVTCLQLYIYNEDKYVVKEGEVTDTMYIVHTGQVLESSGDQQLVRIYQTGEFFGVIQGLQKDLPFTSSYTTIQKSQILSLCIDDWDKLLRHFPVSRNSVYKHLKDLDPDAEKRSSRDYYERDLPRVSRTSSLTPYFTKQPKSAYKSKETESSTFLIRQTSDINLPGVENSSVDIAKRRQIDSISTIPGVYASEAPTTTSSTTPAVKSLTSATRVTGGTAPAATGSLMETILKTAWSFLGGVTSSRAPPEEIREVKIEDLDLNGINLQEPLDGTVDVFRDDSMNTIELSHILNPELMHPLHRDFNLHRQAEPASSEHTEELRDQKSVKSTDEAKDQTTDHGRETIRAESLEIYEDKPSASPSVSTVGAKSSKRRVTYKDIRDANVSTVIPSATSLTTSDRAPRESKGKSLGLEGEDSDSKDSNNKDDLEGDSTKKGNKKDKKEDKDGDEGDEKPSTSK